jgi:hypothetical protein
MRRWPLFVALAARFLSILAFAAMMNQIARRTVRLMRSCLLSVHWK